MHSPVQKIKERLLVEEIISSYLKLEPAGANFKAKCPFHNEKTASFFVSPSRGSYYCFGCGASGDIFTFVEEFEGLDFKGALKLLADKAGVELGSYTKISSEAETEKERLYKAMEEATIFFEENLKSNSEVKKYLESRGLNHKTITDFRIGFALADWRRLYEHLKSKGFSDKEIESAGLAKKPDDKTKAMYDRFRGRVIFPISDSSGRVIAFSGRIFEESVPTPTRVGRPTESVGPKYLNSPDTPIFSKSSVLYGLDKAKDSIRRNNFSILVEGQMDLVLSHQAGYKNTVATSGTALSDSTISKENVVSSLGLIRRLSPNIVLAFDADKAGFNACVRAGRIALSLNMDVKVANLPEGVDPADLISTKGSIEGATLWKEAIKNSKHIIEFLLDKVIKDTKGDMHKGGRVVREKVLPFVYALWSAMEKAHFIKKISDKIGVKEEAIQDDLKKIEHELKYEKRELEGVQESLTTLKRKDYILRRLLGMIFWQKTLGAQQIDIDTTLAEISQLLNIDVSILENSENKEDLIFEAEIFYGAGLGLQKDRDELLFNLKEEFLREELFKHMQELRIAEEGKNEDKISEILKKINEINNKIQNVKNKKT